MKFPRVSEIFGVKKPLVPHNGKTRMGNGREEPDAGRGR